jgi:peptide/nickel transport system ATP-binding protein
MSNPPLLDIQNVTIEFATRRGIVRAVENVSFSVAKGETLALVGESGSGKSVISYATMRILDRAGKIAEGGIVYSGMRLAELSEAQMRDLRGREMSMIFQNPRAALNPIRTVGAQIADVLMRHARATSQDAKEKAIAALEEVRIARPAERYNAYPFELSGGMCQRIVIALALACQPQLLIADEPTTGLDVTTQKAVMDLIVDLTRKRDMSTVLITHDLGLAAAYCKRVTVMEKGKLVETATAADIFANPQHPYTRRLMRATPRLDSTLRDLLPESSDSPEKAMQPAVASDEIVLAVENLVKEYPRPDAHNPVARFFRRDTAPPEPFRAVDGVSFEVRRGESVGLVGESGCGKSTTSTILMRLIDPTSGSIRFCGEDIANIPARNFARHPGRSKLQMVFQDPTESLNPRFTAARAIADPIMRLGPPLAGAEVRARCEELARLVGLPLELLDRLPHQLSGGQKARVGIARAIALDPDLVVLDEPTAALDVSIQAIVLNLLHDLKQRLGMSYLFVSHDLNVVRLLCDRVIVMRAGQIVEQGRADDVLGAPKSEYTRTLLDAIPHPPPQDRAA